MTGPTTPDTMRSAGIQLKRLRLAKELTQQDIERMAADQFGYENRVYAQQVSRIEKGALDKPPILDLLRYGQILGLTPDDIAEMYALWPRQEGGTGNLPKPIREAIQLLDALPFDLREQLLHNI